MNLLNKHILLSLISKTLLEIIYDNNIMKLAFGNSQSSKKFKSFFLFDT